MTTHVKEFKETRIMLLVIFVYDFPTIRCWRQYSRQIFERTTSELTEWEIREKRFLKVTSKKERVKFELIISVTLMFPRS